MKAVFFLGFGKRRTLTDRREVQVPAGWHRVWRGAVVRGDRFLHLGQFFEDGIVQWDEAKVPDAEMYRLLGANQAARYQVLIRRGEPADLPCERCEAEPCVMGERYCSRCRRDVLREIRKAQ